MSNLEVYVNNAAQTPVYYDNLVVMQSTGNVIEVNAYYPYGKIIQGLSTSSTYGKNNYKYNGKELQTDMDLNWLDYGWRPLPTSYPTWFIPDPLAEKYYSWSPYMYVLGNPIKNIDPDGTSTWVMQNADGTYRVIGGNLEDNDKAIYSYSIQDGRLVRESIGFTTSTTSFYNSDINNDEGAWAIGSIINPNDERGDNFLGMIFGKNPPMFDDYMVNARGNWPYDFKSTDGTNRPIEEIDPYRGMPIGRTGRGQIIYTSARDIGNIAAGYVAGINGMTWDATRIALDMYNSIQHRTPSIEGISTRNAEYYGYTMGYNRFNTYQKTKILGNSIFSAAKTFLNWLINR